MFRAWALLAEAELFLQVSLAHWLEWALQQSGMSWLLLAHEVRRMLLPLRLVVRIDLLLKSVTALQ